MLFLIKFQEYFKKCVRVLGSYEKIGKTSASNKIRKCDQNMQPFWVAC